MEEQDFNVIYLNKDIFNKKDVMQSLSKEFSLTNFYADDLRIKRYSPRAAARTNKAIRRCNEVIRFLYKNYPELMEKINSKNNFKKFKGHVENL